MPTMPASRLLVLLYAAAALTGQAYAIVWMKRLTLLLGATLPAVGTVLAVVLTGYTLGAMAVGRTCRNRWNVSRIFAVLQVGLGIWGIALPHLFDAIESIYAGMAPATDTLGHQAIRVALSLPVLLPPAAAMGAVFPLISAAGVSRAFVAGVTGSLAGVLAGTLLLLPGFGIDASLTRLGLANIALGAAAWFLPPVRAASDESPPEPCSRACLNGAALGVAIFLAEIVWLRLVWLIVDQTAYAEGLVVGAVFFSMAIGAGGAMLPRPRLNVILIATATVQLIGIPVIALLDHLWKSAVMDASFAGFLALEFLLALGVVGLPCIGYGYAVPRVCEGFRPRAVGRIWASHYLGGMAAALAAPFLIIPAIGETATLGLATAVLAVPLLLDRKPLVAAAVIAASLLVSLFGDATFREKAAGPDERILLHHTDGSGIVEVYEHVRDGTRTLLSSRRRQEGGNSPDQVWTERMMGRLPVRLQSPHRRILVVGLGTGVTVGAMLEDPGIESLTCVEISPGVLRAARLFGKANQNLFTDPRLTVVLQDGRNFVRLTRDRYDLIMQELFFPYRAGVGSLYTQEHFARCRSRLAPDGRMAQWISMAQIGPDELRTVVRTFQSVFPHASLWRVKGYLMLLGGTQPFKPGPDAPLRRFLAADTSVAAWTEESPINTEDNLLIEYRVPKMYRWINRIELMLENLRGLSPFLQDASALAPGLPDAPTRAGRLVIAGMLAEARGDRASALRDLTRAIELDPDNAEARELLKGMRDPAPR